jgi:hypothetical protein
VQRVTGHRTVEMVMKHHFRPGEGEDFRQAILRAMPKMLANQPERSVKGRTIKILNEMTAKTWRKDQEKAVSLLAGRSDCASLPSDKHDDKS